MSKKSFAEKYNIRPDAPPLTDLSRDECVPETSHTRKLKTSLSLGGRGDRGWIRKFKDQNLLPKGFASCSKTERNYCWRNFRGYTQGK